jgi:pectate lyase
MVVVLPGKSSTSKAVFCMAIKGGTIMLPNSILSQSKKLGSFFLSALSFVSFITLILLISTAYIVLSATSAIAIPSFPGAEGYGANAIGGRGGRVIEVTNLNDSGLGSLREACESSGPRIVVFRVGGTIHLNSDIKINNPYITIAGQTAPGDGITLKAGSLMISNTNNVIIRGLRIRLGLENGTEKDAMASLYGGGINSDIIFDHCSVSWASDENISTYGDNQNITFQWCITSEALLTHSMGMRVGKSGFHNVSIHHNLFAHNNERNPQLSDGSESEVINNLVYNWGNTGTTVKFDARANIINNYYKAGPSTGKNENAAIVYFKTENPLAYLSGNVGPGRPSSDSGDDWDIVDGGSESMRSSSPVVFQSDITTHTAEEAFDLVLNNAGAISPRRDSVDLRVVQSVIDGTGGFISDPSDVGGWPALNSGTPPQDTDHDGMPDAWEAAQGLNPNNSSDSNEDLDGDGYTNIEEYINGLLPFIVEGGTPDTEDPIIPANLTAVAISSSEINLSWNASTDNVGVTGYRIYRDEIQIASTTNTTYQDKGLLSSTSYTYTVSAYDAAGNNSLKANSATATTLAPSEDTESPSVPLNLTATTASSSQIDLSWNTSTDPSTGSGQATGVSGYKIFRNGSQIVVVTTASYSDTDLSPATTYTYTVSAYDAVGNESSQSASASATTQEFVTFSQLFEAEDMNLTSPMTTGIDTNASGGQYISPTSGTLSTSPIPEATISLTVPKTGAYYLWIRIMGPDTSSDALYTGIDTIWDRVYPITTNAYEWVRIETLHNSGKYDFNLTQGTHTLQIGHGEINARADALFVTNDPDNIPTTYDTIPPAPPQGLSFIVP